MTRLEESVLQSAMDTWGFDAQLIMVIEESGELIQAAAKFIGKRETAPESLIEELADVSLMIDQMRFKWGREIDAARFAKLERLAQRLRGVPASVLAPTKESEK